MLPSALPVVAPVLTVGRLCANTEGSLYIPWPARWLSMAVHKSGAWASAGQQQRPPQRRSSSGWRCTAARGQGGAYEGANAPGIT